MLERYVQRIRAAGRSIGISGVEIREIAESRLPETAPRCSAEAGELIALAGGVAGGGAAIVALDETGKNLTSAELAIFLRARLNAGEPQLAFLIGGPDGHGAQVREAATLKLAFGKATWPHQFVRTMLAEQLYRCVTILSGHPYHRG
jgi:23S rRNA (pseudouridine1915-N3)-methyltransferase